MCYVWVERRGRLPCSVAHSRAPLCFAACDFRAQLGMLFSVQKCVHTQAGSMLWCMAMYGTIVDSAGGCAVVCMRVPFPLPLLPSAAAIWVHECMQYNHSEDAGLIYTLWHRTRADGFANVRFTHSLTMDYIAALAVEEGILIKKYVLLLQ